MARRSRSPLDELIATGDAADREEEKRAASTALVVVDGQDSLTVPRATIALNVARGWIADAADVLGVRAIDLDKFIKAHTELKELVKEHKFRDKERIKQNLVEWMRAGDYGATMQLANFEQRKEEADAARPKTPLKEHSFEELEAMQKAVLEHIAKSLPAEQLQKLLETKQTKH